jgi:two-component system CheB/CheR fusion protein
MRQEQTTRADVGLDDLVAYVQRTRGFDFTGYKRTTLERRVQRRMAMVGIADYGAYIDLLQLRPEEITDLFNTILINVTSFFRDPEVWDVVASDALPRLIGAKGGAAPIRAWSVGCSSGQEAYTIAMLVAEHLGKDATARRLKVYATDVDEDALRQARRASYVSADLEALPAGFRDRYFEPAPGGRFELRKELRHCVIFGRHDLIHDAPISRIDLLTCRNTIMYLNAETQQRILARLHFALAPSGVLVLGKAETLLSHSELFDALDLKRRIFAKARADAPPQRIPVRVVPKVAQADDLALRLRQQAFDASPVAQIVVDPSGVVVQISRLARELFALSEQDQGRPLKDLEVSYRPVELRSVLEQAYAQKSVVVVKDIERIHLGEAFHYEVQVTPLLDRETAAPLGAEISFIDITQPVRLQQQLRRTNAELQAAFEQLQSTSEELETTNEELQSTNEELETTNEELQSTNEELEAKNEELQSTNDSQQALNDEVRQRGNDLASANLSLEAILGTLRSAVVAIDRELHVTKWSARAEDLWGLRGDEVIGKSFMGLDIGLPVERLGPSLRACFAGDEVADVVLDATNRRGRSIICKISCIRLAGDGAEPRGIVLVIAETSAG